MAEMERLAEQLPKGFTIDWTGQSLQERNATEQTPWLMTLSGGGHGSAAAASGMALIRAPRSAARLLDGPAAESD